MWTFADISVIARSRQKDEYYVNNLGHGITKVIQGWFGACTTHWIDVNRLATFVYYGLTFGNAKKTLGEEYCRLLPVDANAKTLPSLMSRILFILSKLVKSPNWLKSLAPLHLVLFYWYGRYAEFGRRLLGLRYINHPRLDVPRPIVTNMYRLISASLLGVILFNLYEQIKLFIKQKDCSPLVDNVMVAEQTICRLCLDKRRNTAVTPCGHLFCWDCIYHWLGALEEEEISKQVCPLCRQPCKLSLVYCIVDPFLAG